MTVNELVEKVTKFEIGEISFVGKHTLIFEKNGTERILRCESIGSHYEKYDFSPRTLTEEEWNTFFHKVFGECKVMDYSEEYESEMLITDLPTWVMHIEFSDSSKKESRGSNAFPENWKILAKAFAEYDSFYDYKN